MRRALSHILVTALATAALAGCGSSDDGSQDSGGAATIPASLTPHASDFRPAGGRTLQQIADTVHGGLQAGLATSTFVPGTNRLAFGIIDGRNRFVYGKGAVYVAPTPSSKAAGPFLAPIDSLAVKAPFRSQTSAADTGAPKQIYAARVPFEHAGTIAVLVVAKVGKTTYGAATQVKVRASSPIPAVGARARRVDTPTRASVGGDLARIDTRVPHDDMHEVSFKDVVGKKPVALLFATPQLCQSRVCGPVVDIAEQLKAAYGDRMAFIHQEVYRDNEISKGLRPQMQALHLQTEPWLFTFTRDGRVAARLEGSFGVNEFRSAVQAALRG